MSKVRIYGDTSGYVDIAVPAVAGTRTLNLDKVPQTATNGNTGIGTDNPSQNLHVSSTDHTRVLITGGTDKYAELQFENDAQKFAMGVQNDDKFFLYNSTGTSQVLTVDTSNNVGIGTQTPEYPLQVSGSNVSSGGGLATLGIYDTGTAYDGTNPGGGITFRGKYNNAGDLTNFATIQGIKENATDGNYNTALRFTTRQDGGNLTEQMRIDSSGNLFVFTGGVGVGTSSTSGVKLYVKNTGTSSTTSPKTLLTLDNSPSSGTPAEGSGSQIEFRGKNPGGGTSIYGHIAGVFEQPNGFNQPGSGGTLQFATDGYVGSSTTRMTINSEGKVGIGVVNPQATLHLDTGTSGVPRIRFDHQNANADVFEIGSGVDGQTNAGFSIKDVDANATRLAIDDNGIFMLNKLYSNGALTGFEHRGTGQTWITMNQATNEAVLYINQTTGGGNNNADSGLVIKGHGTNAASGQSTLLRVEGLNTTHGAIDAFTVTNNGRVGIGTYKPTTNLNIIAGNGGGLLMSTYFSGTVTSGMSLGELGFKGYADGNTTAGADAKIVGAADGNHSGTSAPARLDFYTKDSSIGPGSAPTRRFRIDEQGAAFVHASKNNWSRFVQGDNTSVHYRLYGASSSTTNYNLLRYRRHYWGAGSVHITLFQTYYSTTSQGEYWLAGHGRSDGSYTPNYNLVYRDIYNGPGSGRLSINQPGGAPGNSDSEIVDVSISIPAYVHYIVKVEVSHSTFYPTTSTMPGVNSYALFS